MAEIKEELELELYIVRHGESTGNVPDDGTQRSYELREDVRLTPRGEQQAELLGDRFSETDFDCIIASGFSRTIATASAVARKQGAKGAHRVEINPRFCECGTRTYPGRTIEQIQAEFPLAVRAEGHEQTELFMISDEDGENSTRMTRALECAEYIHSRFHSGETVMIAAHAAFNTFLLYAFLGLDCNQQFDPGFCNTGVTKIQFFKKGTGRYADIRLLYMNEHSHLYSAFPGVAFDET